MVKLVAGLEPSLDISSYGLPHRTVRHLYLQLIEYIYDPYCSVNISVNTCGCLGNKIMLGFLVSAVYSGGVESSTAISRLPLWLSGLEIHADLALRVPQRHATPRDKRRRRVSHKDCRVPCASRHRQARDESIFEQLNHSNSNSNSTG